MNKGKILIVDDEPGIVRVISDLLLADGYVVLTADNGSSGLAVALAERPDLIVLDLMLPGIPGIEVCKNIRLVGYKGAILMLTALGEVADRVRGLRSGADDYLPKPVDLGELLARIEALLRRTGVGVRPELDAPIEVGDLFLDFPQAIFTKGGKSLHLSGKEIALLHLLIENRKEVVSRDMILAKAWKEKLFVTPRTVDVHIAWLRQKIEDHPEKPRFIATVRGEGYTFCG